jgi:hypothetical protein
MAICFSMCMDASLKLFYKIGTSFPFQSDCNSVIANSFYAIINAQCLASSKLTRNDGSYSRAVTSQLAPTLSMQAQSSGQVVNSPKYIGVHLQRSPFLFFVHLRFSKVTVKPTSLACIPRPHSHRRALALQQTQLSSQTRQRPPAP